MKGIRASCCNSFLLLSPPPPVKITNFRHNVEPPLRVRNSPVEVRSEETLQLFHQRARLRSLVTV